MDGGRRLSICAWVRSCTCSGPAPPARLDVWTPTGYSRRVPRKRVWIPPKTGVPPWLPPNVTGGYWTEIDVPTEEERAQSARSAQAHAQRQREHSEAVAAASAELACAGTVVEIARLLQADRLKPQASRFTLDMFDEASCLSAWRTLVGSDEFPATHDLVEWKTRNREWGFYLRQLPDSVVRATRRAREPLWEIPDAKRWVCASGSVYRIAGTSPVARRPPRPEVQDGLLAPSTAHRGQAVVPRGKRFQTEHRRTSGGGRPEHFVASGFHVEPAGLPRGMERVDAGDLMRFLSQ